MNRLALVRQGLATWRLTELLHDESGPFDSIERWRDWLVADPASVWRREANTIVGCRWCLSVWTGVAVVMLPRWAVDALALSAFSLLVAEARERIDS